MAATKRRPGPALIKGKNYSKGKGQGGEINRAARLRKAAAKGAKGKGGAKGGGAGGG